MSDKVQCVIYARLSDKSDGDNIENQIYVCEEYAKKNDYQILIIVFFKRSGRDSNSRPRA